MHTSFKVVKIGKKEMCFCWKIQMDNPDGGEEWRCYILTVCKVGIHVHAYTHMDNY